MAARINDLKAAYAKLTLTLPEELLVPQLERELTNTVSTFGVIFKEDRDNLLKTIKEKKQERYISLGNLERGSSLLTTALQPDDTTFKNKNKKAKFLISHWFMAAYSLRMVVTE